MTLASDIRSVFEFRPAPGRVPVAVQAALAMGIPTIGFALAGRAELGLLASSGAFAALCFSDRTRRERARLTPLVGAALIVSSMLGVAGSFSVVLATVAVLVCGIAGSAFMLALRSGPPGGLFFVLVAGVGGHLAAPVAARGEALDARLVVAMVAVGAAIACLVVLAPLLVPVIRRRDAARFAQGSRMPLGLDPTARVILLRLSTALVIGAAVAVPLGIHRGYWVLVAIAAIMQNAHRLRMSAVRGVHRIVGTLLGVGLFALIALLHPSGLGLAILVTVLQFAVEMLVVRNYGLALVFVTPLALSISSAAAVDAVAVSYERAVDTVLGGAIAFAIMGAAWLARGWRARA